jgi:hypothetical protein
VIDMAQRTVGMLVLVATTAGLIGCAGTDGTGPQASGPR